MFSFYYIAHSLKHSIETIILYENGIGWYLLRIKNGSFDFLGLFLSKSSNGSENGVCLLQS